MLALHLECSAEEKDRLIAEPVQQGTAGIVEEDAPGGRAASPPSSTSPSPRGPGRMEAALGNRPGPRIGSRSRNRSGRRSEVWRALLSGPRLEPGASSARPHPPGHESGSSLRPGCIPPPSSAAAMERHVAPGSSCWTWEPARAFSPVPATLLGASPFYACDIDPAAVFAAHLPNLFLGSAGGAPVRFPVLPDLVVAKPSMRGPACACAPESPVIRKPAGRVILSGFPRRPLERVRAAFPARTEAPGTIRLDRPWLLAGSLLRIPAPARERPRDVARLDRLLDHVGHLKAQGRSPYSDG